MTETYENLLSDLRHEIEAGDARPTVIDIAVNELVSAGDRRLPADLLLLLSDVAQHDEGMFSLIHAAENSDDKSYIKSLLTVFPALISQAPRWASIVLMRVLNNSPTQLELVRQLRDASSTEKESIRDMCDRINRVSPQFLSKTTPVTLAAR
jgi:hypothetical protein